VTGRTSLGGTCVASVEAQIASVRDFLAGVSSGRKITRNFSGGAACVGFAGPPGQATRSGDRVMCFKKFSFKSGFVSGNIAR